MGNKASGVRKVFKKKTPEKEDTNASTTRAAPAASKPPKTAATAAASASAAVKDKLKPTFKERQPEQPTAEEEKLGLRHIDFINVHRKDYTGRIELLQGTVEKLSKADETDLLIVYLSERGSYKGNRDSALAGLNRCGISLEQLEKETKPQPSYRKHYHCWLSRQISRPRPPGFEYKRLLVYEDPGEELTQDDNIVLDIMNCMTTVIGGDIQIASVMLPLSGALLSPSLRKHFVQAAIKVTYAWMMMGLPLRIVKILLPDSDISRDIEVFQHTKEKLLRSSSMPASLNQYDVFMSYSAAEKEAADRMISTLRSKSPGIRIYDAEARDVKVRDRGIVHQPVMEAISKSRFFLPLLSDSFFNAVECTEAFSLAYCRDFDLQGNFIIPLYWRNCDLTPMARRLVATEGVDCREASFEAAYPILEEILRAVKQADRHGPTEISHDAIEETKPAEMQLADALLMKRKKMEEHSMIFEPSERENKSYGFLDKSWIDEWAVDFKSIIFGARIGAGGFGEVYKGKFKDDMVAVKTLQRAEDEEHEDVVKEFLVEMKLMSGLVHPNIVKFIGAAVEPPNLAIVLEFMQGGSLYRAIHRRRRNMMGAFPLLKATWIAYGVAKGMEYLHSQYPVIVHRDLKSPNILLGSNVHQVKVSDFGLSRLRVSTYIKTGPGGTPEWMAPELLRQERFDESSDVFSFGVVLWELLTCEKPWKDEHPMQIVFKVGSRGEKLVLPPTVQAPQEFKDMINSCFHDKPARRPQFSSLAKSLVFILRKIEAQRAAAENSDQ